MTTPRSPSDTRLEPRSAGYTLLELLVVMTLIGIFALIGMPALDKGIQRTKMESFNTEVASLMRMARYEAIKMHAPAVVRLDMATSRVEAFMDLDDNGLFAPDTSKEDRETDYRIGRPYQVPNNLFIWAPQDGAPKGPNSVDGFTPHPDGSSPNQLVIEADGTLRDIGAFRFGDSVGNFLEVRASPRASGRVQVLKWDPDATEWYTKGEDGKPWRWY